MIDYIKNAWDKIEKQFSNIVLKGGSIIPQSNEYYLLSLIYGWLEEIVSAINSIEREKDPKTACCEKLYEIGKRYNLYPIPQSKNAGIVKLTGKCGALLPYSAEFDFKGIKFYSTFVDKSEIDLLPRIDGNGEAYMFIETLEDKVDIEENSKGKLIGKYANINNEVQLVGSICPGKPQESCELFRSRLLNKLSFKSTTYQDIISEVFYNFPCVTNVFVLSDPVCCSFSEKYKNLHPDYLYVFPVFANKFAYGKIPENIINLMQKWLFGVYNGDGSGKMPIGVKGYVLQITPVKITIRISLFNTVPYLSKLVQIKNAIETYVNNLYVGKGITEFAILKIINDYIEDLGGICLEFKSSDADVNLQKDVVVNCDMKLFAEVKFYNNEGNEINLNG